MAEEFQTGICGGNWWDSARNRFNSGSSPSVSSSMALESSGSNLVWSSQLDIKANSSMDSASVPGNSETFRDTHKLQDSNSECVDPNLHMMGLSLSPQAVDWHQALL